MRIRTKMFCLLLFYQIRTRMLLQFMKTVTVVNEIFPSEMEMIIRFKTKNKLLYLSVKGVLSIDFILKLLFRSI